MRLHEVGDAFTLRAATMSKPAPSFSIRPAGPADLPALPEIERMAGAPFREIGMQAVADDELPDVDDLASFVAAGQAWVATTQAGLVAYLLAEVVDGTGHID